MLLQTCATFDHDHAITLHPLVTLRTHVDYAQLMHRALYCHGLKESLRLLAAHKPPARRTYRTRTFTGTKPFAQRKRDDDLRQPAEIAAGQRSPLQASSNEAPHSEVSAARRTLAEFSSDQSATHDGADEAPTRSPPLENPSDALLQDGSFDRLLSNTVNPSAEAGEEPSSKDDIDKEGVEPQAPGGHGRIRQSTRQSTRQKGYIPSVQESFRAVHRRGKDGPVRALDRESASSQTLEDELRWIARTRPDPRQIQDVLRILIKDRKINPDPRHYEALILANCSAELGSVDNVKSIIEQMEREGVAISPSIHYAVLTVSFASCHPLRTPQGDCVFIKAPSSPP